MESVRPFKETLTQLMDMENVSVREVGRRCERHGGISFSAISQLRQGRLSPSMKAMAEVARALGVPAETFAEYRLGKARASLDPDQVGLHKALVNLARMQGVPTAQGADEAQIARLEARLEEETGRTARGRKGTSERGGSRRASG